MDSAAETRSARADAERPREIASSDGQSHEFVCLFPSDWGVVRSNPDYTALGLAARGHRVLVVEPMLTLSSVLRVALWQKRKVRHRWGLRAIGPNLWAYAPPPIGLPGLSRSPLLGRASARILAHLLRKPLRELGFKDPIVWSFMYNAGETLRALAAKLRIYECGDDDQALARTDAQRHTVRTLEAEACKAADLVLCVTEELCAPRRAHNPATFEVNCAADTAFFGRALDPATAVPPSIAALRKPVLGYMGGLDPWKVDVDLLLAIARAHPDWSIALVGYVWFGFDASIFGGAQNIHVVGPQRYEDFPALVKGMDVCLMPFPLNDITRNGDALKCYEYLAAGKPVVGRAVPVARRLAPYVRIADTADEFVRAIEGALAEPPEAVQERADFARKHDWRERVEQKLGLIRDALDRAAG